MKYWHSKKASYPRIGHGGDTYWKRHVASPIIFINFLFDRGHAGTHRGHGWGHGWVSKCNIFSFGVHMKLCLCNLNNLFVCMYTLKIWKWFIYTETHLFIYNGSLKKKLFLHTWRVPRHVRIPIFLELPCPASVSVSVLLRYRELTMKLELAGQLIFRAAIKTKHNRKSY